jgi:hypothetical protein
MREAIEQAGNNNQVLRSGVLNEIITKLDTIKEDSRN